MQLHKRPTHRDRGLNEKWISSADTLQCQYECLSRFSDLSEDLIRDILGRLSLQDFVHFHFGCSKATRTYTSARVFEGEPFFLREPPRVLSERWFYAVFMKKWLNLSIPVRNLKAVSASGGLILFSGVGIPPEDCLFKMRSWWPLVVVNPITRENRLLSLRLEFPPEWNEVTWYRNCCLDVQMGLKVNAASKTYKVVVYWKYSNVVQIFDSGSKQWSTVSVPRELGAYANSSNEIILCRSCLRWDEHQSILFDIRQGRLVNCQSPEARTGVLVDNNKLPSPEHIIRGYPTVGELCLYAVDYNMVDPVTFVHMYKKEKIQIAWQLVAEVPLNLLCHYLEVKEISNIFLRQSQLVIHECGEHLLFSATYRAIWCGMLYDLTTQRWIRHFIVDKNHGNAFNDGLFFQPQLTVCPC